MKIDDSLLEIHEFHGEGYLPLVEYQGWRVAMLRYCDELLPQHIDKMQRHDETDEVFVLLTGRCILFIGEGQQKIHQIYAQDMQRLKLYNIKKGCYHSHTLSPDASVLIVENSGTGNKNSTDLYLSMSQQQQLMELTRDIWKV